MKTHFNYLDVLKAVAIIGVVLYHAGFSHYGYLGVDIFLVINGYLLAKNFSKLQTWKDEFNFLSSRLLRLWPVVIIASIVCLVWGAYWMLPDDYEGVAQDVVATNVWANNILMSIKASNYWAVSNDFKPLMHTWYLGIIVQFYVVFSLIIILTKKILKPKQDITIHIAGICFMISLVMFLLPKFGMTAKFYFLQFRVFEFCAGCWLALWFKDHSCKVFTKQKLVSAISVIAYITVIALLFVNHEGLVGSVKLLLIVFLTCVLLVCLPYVSANVDKIISNKWVALIGKCSFSIYIWHQIVFAFCRYSFTSEFSLGVFALLLLITAILSTLTYNLVENKVSLKIKEDKGKRNVIIATLAGAAVCISVSLYLYSISGVIRDVPELDTYKGKAFRGMHIAYNEKARRFDHDFVEPEKIHWVVVGDSYGRDWTNVLSESSISEKVEISYISEHDVVKVEKINRIKNADIVFFTTSIIPDEKRLNNFIIKLNENQIGTNNLYVIGSKLFGVSNGQVYAHRNRNDYYEATAIIDEKYFSKNEEFKSKWENHYIDMITPVSVGDNRVKVFSDNHKYISQDCEHFTQGGAQYYARILKPIIEDLIAECQNTENCRDIKNGRMGYVN